MRLEIDFMPEALRQVDDDFILEWEQRRAERGTYSENYDEAYFDMLHEEE